MKTQSLSIDLIRTDGGTQMRAELDRDVYMDYRDKFIAGVEFTEVDVFHDGSVYWLADGFHRFYGAREAKRGSIKSNVHQGTVRDAILFAVGANQAHGLRRTNADKRNSVLKLLNDEAWVLWADNKIAEACGVSQHFVSDVRKQLKSDLSSPAAKTADAPKEGKDGKKRKPPKATKKATAGSNPAVVPQERHDSRTATDEDGELLNAHVADFVEDAEKKLFADLLEHIRQAVILTDKCHNATGKKSRRHEMVMNSMDIAGQEAKKWRDGK